MTQDVVPANLPELVASNPELYEFLKALCEEWLENGKSIEFMYRFEALHSAVGLV